MYCNLFYIRVMILHCTIFNSVFKIYKRLDYILLGLRLSGVKINCLHIFWGIANFVFDKASDKVCDRF